MNERTSRNAFGKATGQTSLEDARRHAASMMREREVFDQKAGEYRGQIHSQQTLEKLDLDRRHQQQRGQLDDRLQKTYGEQKGQDQDQLKKLQEKAQKDALTEQERERAKALQANLANVRQREDEQRGALKQKQAKETKSMADKHQQQNDGTERSIAVARQERQLAGWKPAPVVFNEVGQQKGEISFQKPAQSAESSQGGGMAPKTVASSPRPSLTPRGAKTGNLKPPGQEVGQAKGKKSDVGL